MKREGQEAVENNMKSGRKLASNTTKLKSIPL